MAFVDHNIIENFAHERINLFSELAAKHRAQVTNLRERLEKKIDADPAYGLATVRRSSDAMARHCAQGYDCVVTTAAETLLEQALTLPVEDRALLASGLLASLDSEALDEAEAERLWSEETNRRATQMGSGEAEVVTWDHLLQRIDERRS